MIYKRLKIINFVKIFLVSEYASIWGLYSSYVSSSELIEFLCEQLRVNKIAARG